MFVKVCIHSQFFYMTMQYFVFSLKDQIKFFILDVLSDMQ